MVGLISEPAGSAATQWEDIGAQVPSSGIDATPWVRDTSLLGSSTADTAATYGAYDPETGTPTAPPEPTITKEAARQLDDTGRLSFDHDMPLSVVQGMIARKHAEMIREDAQARRPGGFWAGVTNFGLGAASMLLDPVDIASLLIPVLPEARIAERVAQAGLEGLAGRTVARVAAGAGSGAIQQAALAVPRYALSQQEQADYGASDVLWDTLYGSLLGGAVHGTIGLGREALGGADDVTRAFEQTRLGRVMATDPAARQGVMKAALAAVVEDRPVDVEPLGDLYQAGQPATLADLERMANDERARHGEVPEPDNTGPFNPKDYGENGPDHYFDAREIAKNTIEGVATELPDNAHETAHEDGSGPSDSSTEDPFAEPGAAAKPGGTAPPPGMSRSEYMQWAHQQDIDVANRERPYFQKVAGGWIDPERLAAGEHHLITVPDAEARLAELDRMEFHPTQYSPEAVDTFYNGYLERRAADAARTDPGADRAAPDAEATKIVPVADATARKIPPSLGNTAKEVWDAWGQMRSGGGTAVTDGTIIGDGGTYFRRDGKLYRSFPRAGKTLATFREATRAEEDDVWDAIQKGQFQISTHGPAGLGQEPSSGGTARRVDHQATGRPLPDAARTDPGADRADTSDLAARIANSETVRQATGGLPREMQATSDAADQAVKQPPLKPGTIPPEIAAHIADLTESLQRSDATGLLTAADHAQIEAANSWMEQARLFGQGALQAAACVARGLM